MLKDSSMEDVKMKVSEYYEVIDTYHQNFKEDKFNTKNVSPEAKLPIENSIVNHQINHNETGAVPEGSSIEDVKMKVLEYYGKDEAGNSGCKICGKVMRGKNHTQDMKRHIETHLDGITYSCRICGKQFRSSHSLRYHKSFYHR